MTIAPKQEEGASQQSLLTLVTVVFEAELPLLHLQARSLRRYTPDDLFEAVLVIDNTRRGLTPRARSALLREYGDRASRVRILRPDEIAALPAARGWVSQQVLKLLVHAQVRTPFYLVLDAKNHWLQPTGAKTFLNPDGRARGASHEYVEHPLRPTLERVLRYFDLDPAPWIANFPATHTPVVLSTELVSRMTQDVAARSGRSFAEEFVRAGLTEFFLYSAWIVATFGDIASQVDGTLIRSANVWPARSSASDFARSLSDAALHRSPFLSVHRTALARAGWSGTSRLASFWVEHELFSSRAAALRFLATFKARYLWTMSARKLRTRLSTGRVVPGFRRSVDPSELGRSHAGPA